MESKLFVRNSIRYHWLAVLSVATGYSALIRPKTPDVTLPHTPYVGNTMALNTAIGNTLVW